MRLFQAQNFCGDTVTSPPLPPHFSIDREVTRAMPVYLNLYRDGRRLPTPEKEAVMELSNSFERRRLGKHQRILKDISERCRAQEITDLSNKLSAKISLRKFEKPSKEMSFYSTAFMGSKNRTLSDEQHYIINPRAMQEVDGSRPLFEKNYKHFPARKIMRQQTKFEFLRQNTTLPKLAPEVFTSPLSDSHLMNLKATLAQRQQINGPIQLAHYISPRAYLAPLVLPSVDIYNVGIQSERLDRTGSCFSAIRVTLGPRTKTNMTLESTLGGTFAIQNVAQSATTPPRLRQ